MEVKLICRRYGQPCQGNETRRKIMRRQALLGLTALGLLCGSGAQAETVKVGVILSFSGVNADLGNQIDKAFDLYVKLHAKDIEPHKIELVKRDEGPPSGAEAKTAATELITRDKVKLLAGVVFSPSANRNRPVVSPAK